MNNLNQMAVFAKVVESKSFSRAAEQLGIGKSAVSMRISQLEKELGIRLLHRTTRHLRLSEAGQAYYQGCIRVVEEAQRANDRAKTYKNDVSGFLKMTCPVGFGNRVLLPAMQTFLAENPNIEIELVQEDRDLNLVTEGIDLAIRVASLPDSSMIAKPLAATRVVVCASPDYFKKNGMPTSITDMENHPWILFSHVPARLKYQHNNQQYVINTRGKVTVNNEQARLTLAKAGFGLAFMPMYEAWEAINNGQLQEVTVETHAPLLPITALYHDRQYISTKIKIFIDFLRLYLNKQVWAIT